MQYIERRICLSFAVLIDFGSTYTKVACIDVTGGDIVLTDKFPSTVHSDARVCLEQCFNVVKASIGERAFRKSLKLSSSSAAGGLKMAVIGLSESLSLTAGKNCAYGAGGRIIINYFGRITEEQVDELVKANADIVLLCGGYEMGSRTAVLHNAEMLAESSLKVPVIYAGNSAVDREVRNIFVKEGKECFLVRNVIPSIGKLDTEDAEFVIRNVFMKRITNMKGLHEVQIQTDGAVIPTPVAVLNAGMLLSQGIENQKGLGHILIVDVGGATTDVYSFCENSGYKGAKIMGALEPMAKRTVEGDMGMRESSICIQKEIGVKALVKGAGVTDGMLESGICKRMTQTSFIPDSEEEMRIDSELAKGAIAVAVRRHAGYIEKVLVGCGARIQIGKNLTNIETVVGTGGVIVNSPDPSLLMRTMFLRAGESEDILIPRRGVALIDREYILFAAGLLKPYDKEVAFNIMKRSIMK